MSRMGGGLRHFETGEGGWEEEIRGKRGRVYIFSGASNLNELDRNGLSSIRTTVFQSFLSVRCHTQVLMSQHITWLPVGVAVFLLLTFTCDF